MPSPTAKRSKTSRPARDGDAGATRDVADDGPAFLPPLRPQRRLTLIAAAVLAAWLVGLLVLYFTSIRPARTVLPASGRTQPVAPAEGPAAGR